MLTATCNKTTKVEAVSLGAQVEGFSTEGDSRLEAMMESTDDVINGELMRVRLPSASPLHPESTIATYKDGEEDFLAECIAFALDKLHQSMKIDDEAWRALRFRVKDVFDVDAAPTSISDKYSIAFIEDAPVSTSYATMEEEGVVYIYGDDEDFPPQLPARGIDNVTNVRAVLQMLENDEAIGRLNQAAMTGHVARLKELNAVIRDIRIVLERHANTMWMLCWHRAAGNTSSSYDDALRGKVKRLREALDDKQNKLDALFDPCAPS